MTQNNDNKIITFISLAVFTGIAALILGATGGGLGFMLAPMACDSPNSCKSIFSNLAVYMLMFFPIEIIIGLILGWRWYFTQQYKKAILVTWGCSAIWIGFIAIGLFL